MWKVMLVMLALIGILLINRQFPLFFDKAQATPERLIAEKKIDLDHDGQTETVKKIRTKAGLTVRISDETDINHSKILAKYAFEFGEDSYTFLNTKFSNLDFADITRDGQLEILVSVFDKKSQKSELNILAWDKKKKTLEKINKEY